MNKEILEEVGKLLDVDSSEIKESKIKQIWRKLTFPLVQISSFILSLISGVLFGYWENQIPSTYPYGGFVPRVHSIGILTILGLNTGNIIFSTINHKKSGLRTLHTILIVFLNVAISIAGFFLLYHAIESVPPFTDTVDYDTYRKTKNVY